MSVLVEKLCADGLMAFHLTNPRHADGGDHFSVSYMGVTAPHPCFAATDAATGSACAFKHRRVDIKAYPVEEMVSLLG